jgi:predicted ArsR family transcriptional regulator
MGPATSAPEAMDRLLRLLDEAGFAPEPGQSADGPIRLRRCPFGALARERRDVVCGVHLGLMRGALRQMGAPLDAVALEPFVQPDLCLAHLAPDATGAT